MANSNSGNITDTEVEALAIRLHEAARGSPVCSDRETAWCPFSELTEFRKDRYRYAARNLLENPPPELCNRPGGRSCLNPAAFVPLP